MGNFFISALAVIARVLSIAMILGFLLPIVMLLIIIGGIIIGVFY